MFIMSIRLSKRRIAAIIFCTVLCFFALGYLFFGSDGTEPVDTREVFSTAAETPGQRIAFIEHFGWEVEPEPLQFREVSIPHEFDNVFVKYNEIQKEMGMNLEKYKGKRCKLYTYEVKNHPSGSVGILLNLLVYDGKVVGGDVCSPALDGFMHSLKMP